MHRRCQFLEHLQVHGISVIKEATSQLCSTLLKLMLDEVEAFTNPQIQGTWSKSIPFQVHSLTLLSHVISTLQQEKD